MLGIQTPALEKSRNVDDKRGSKEMMNRDSYCTCYLYVREYHSSAVLIYCTRILEDVMEPGGHIIIYTTDCTC